MNGLKLNKIYNMDCLEGMSQIPDKSVDMILCDLPYGMTACSWDTIIPFDQMWEQFKRVTKENSPIVLTASQPFTSLLVMSNLKMFRHEWVWEKENGTNFLNVKYQPFKVHESVLVFSKKKNKYFPIMTQGTPYETKAKGTSGKVTKEVKKVANKNNGTRYPRSVQRFNRQVGIHPTQKPVRLFEYLIKTYSQEGDTVLDCCMGSGTAAIACLNTNRNFIGFELDEEYYKKSLERIETVRKSLNGKIEGG